MVSTKTPIIIKGNEFNYLNYTPFGRKGRVCSGAALVPLAFATGAVSLPGVDKEVEINICDNNWKGVLL